MGKDQDGQPAPFLLERLPWFERPTHPKHLHDDNIPSRPTWQCVTSAQLSRDNASRLCLCCEAEVILQCSLCPKTPARSVNRTALHLHPQVCSGVRWRKAVTALTELGRAQGGWVDAASAPTHSTASQHLPQVPLKTCWLLQ